jgi:hypothetical protein
MKNIFRIQYASNLNLNKSCLKTVIQSIKPCAPTLALLGDIGTPECERTEYFMKWCSSTYDKVYWVPGFLELSDTENKKHTWVERYDYCSTQINKWNLDNLSLCSKKEVHLKSPDIQLLLTTLWHPTEANLYMPSNNGPRPMNKEDFRIVMNTEYSWILRKSSVSTKPVVWLTYSSPYTDQINSIRVPLFMSTYIHPLFRRSRSAKLHYPNLLCNLYGYSNPAHSCSGGTPWSSINMGGHSGFIKNAFWEYSDKCN